MLALNTNQIHLKLNPKSAFIFFSEPPFAVEQGFLYRALTILCMQALRVVFLSQYSPYFKRMQTNTPKNYKASSYMRPLKQKFIMEKELHQMVDLEVRFTFTRHILRLQPNIVTVTQSAEMKTEPRYQQSITIRCRAV